jgi:hypothetical protein
MKSCDWPKCTAQSERPFTDGWANYSAAEDTLDGLPAAGWLCPDHKLAFEDLAVDKPPLTDSAH